jgi:hypothetical protein
VLCINLGYVAQVMHKTARMAWCPEDFLGKGATKSADVAETLEVQGTFTLTKYFVDREKDHFRYIRTFMIDQGILSFSMSSNSGGLSRISHIPVNQILALVTFVAFSVAVFPQD